MLKAVNMFRQVDVAFFVSLSTCFVCTTLTNIVMENRTSYYHQFCPYSDFCTQNATKVSIFLYFVSKETLKINEFIHPYVYKFKKGASYFVFVLVGLTNNI